jgi:hypothetical protein
MVVGRPSLRPTSPSSVDSLRGVGVPVTSLEGCAGCADPCEAAEEWSFKVDLASDLLGSVKPYGRLVVCSEFLKDSFAPYARALGRDSRGSTAVHKRCCKRKLIDRLETQARAYPTGRAK